MFSGSTLFLLSLIQLGIGIVLGMCLADWFRDLILRIRRFLDAVVERRMRKESEPVVQEARSEAVEDHPKEVADVPPPPAEDPPVESADAQGGIDSETALPDSEAFEYSLSREITLAQRRRAPLCVVLCEADQFAQIRGEQGDLVGAEVMQSIATLLISGLNENTIVARYDDAQFAILLPGCDLEAGKQLASGLHQTVAASTFGDEVNGAIEATLSVGLAELLPDDDLGSLLMRVDITLQTARESGGGCAFLHNGATCERIEAVQAEPVT